MRFWDSSGIVPLLVSQALSQRTRQLFNGDPEVVVWWATRVECASAVARLSREGAMDAVNAGAALARLREFARVWDEVEPSERLRTRAERLLRAHSLRAADALQLSALLEIAGDTPLALEVVCFDERLREAVLREGFQVAQV